MRGGQRASLPLVHFARQNVHLCELWALRQHQIGPWWPLATAATAAAAVRVDPLLVEQWCAVGVSATAVGGGGSGGGGSGSGRALEEQQEVEGLQRLAPAFPRHLVLQHGVERVVVGPRGRLPPREHPAQQHQTFRPLVLLQQGAQEQRVQGGVGALAAGPHEQGEYALRERRLYCSREGKRGVR